MKLLYKNKILISGIFPLENFTIDGYLEKTGSYDDKIMDFDNPDSIFYPAGYLIKSSYSCVGEKGTFYEYFESEKPLEYEVDEKLNKKEIQRIFLEDQVKRVNLLQEKLRLLTGLGISLPVFFYINL